MISPFIAPLTAGPAARHLALVAAVGLAFSVAAAPRGGGPPGSGYGAGTEAANPKFVPIGGIIMFGGMEAPTGWLLCDGSEVSRDDHSNLFDAIGTTYGAGDGSTTFNVPDMRQRFPLGLADAGTGSALGEQGGEIDHDHDLSANTSAVGNHAHGVSGATTTTGDHGHAVNGSTATAGSHGHGVSGTTASGGSHAHGVSGSTAAAGGHGHSYSGTVNGVGGHQHVVMYRAPTPDPANGTFALWHTGDGQRIMRGRIGGNSASGQIASADGDQIYQGFGVFGQEFRSAIDGAHAHSYAGNTDSVSDHSHAFSATSASAGDHAHGFSATATAAGDHLHALTATAANAGSHAHDLNTTSAAGGSHAHSLDGATTASNPPYFTLDFIIKE